MKKSELKRMIREQVKSLKESKESKLTNDFVDRIESEWEELLEKLAESTSMDDKEYEKTILKCQKELSKFLHILETSFD